MTWRDKCGCMYAFFGVKLLKPAVLSIRSTACFESLTESELGGLICGSFSGQAKNYIFKMFFYRS